MTSRRALLKEVAEARTTGYAYDEGGVIALGAPASLAVWDVAGDLVVQTPDARVAAWSTDPRAGGA